MGRPPMPQALRDKLQGLILSELLSDTEIADRLGLGRTTVYLERQALLTDDGGESLSHLAAGETYCRKPVRCRGCGGLVRVLPCRLCLTREGLENERHARRRSAMGLGASYHRVPLKQGQLFDGPDLPPPKTAQVGGRYSSLTKHFKRRNS